MRVGLRPQRQVLGQCALPHRQARAALLCGHPVIVAVNRCMPGRSVSSRLSRARGKSRALRHPRSQCGGVSAKVARCGPSARGALLPGVVVESRSVAVVGTRKPSSEGVKRTRQLVRDLVKSGLRSCPVMPRELIRSHTRLPSPKGSRDRRVGKATVKDLSCPEQGPATTHRTGLSPSQPFALASLSASVPDGQSLLLPGPEDYKLRSYKCCRDAYS
jgi:hypothetical protein